MKLNLLLQKDLQRKEFAEAEVEIALRRMVNLTDRKVSSRQVPLPSSPVVDSVRRAIRLVADQKHLMGYHRGSGDRNQRQVHCLLQRDFHLVFPIILAFEFV